MPRETPTNEDGAGNHDRSQQQVPFVSDSWMPHHLRPLDALRRSSERVKPGTSSTNRSWKDITRGASMVIIFNYIQGSLLKSASDELVLSKKQSVTEEKER